MSFRRSTVRAACFSAVFLVLCVTSSYGQAKDYAVSIGSDPKGATIRLDNKKGRRLGKTPIRERLKRGSYTLYIYKHGYEPAYQTIEVVDSPRRQEFFFELRRLVYGEVKVVAAGRKSIEGARILLDGKELGHAPDTLKKVPVGPHQIEVVKSGYRIFEEWIEVKEEETSVVRVELERDSETEPEDDEGYEEAEEKDDGQEVEEKEDEDYEELEEDEDYGDEEEEEEDYEAEEIDAPAAEQPAFVYVSVGPEFGSRSFSYTVPSSVVDAPRLRPYEASLVPMLRVNADVFPLATAKNPFLSGWGLSGSYALGFGVSTTTAMNETIDTSWTEWDAAVRFKYRLKQGRAFVGMRGGFGSQKFGFTVKSDEPTELANEVPAVNYAYIGVGLEGGYRFGESIQTWLQLRYHNVSKLGALGVKFEQTKVAAYGGLVGLSYKILPALDAQVVGNLRLYQHDFLIRSNERASGSDRFWGLMLGAVYHR